MSKTTSAPKKATAGKAAVNKDERTEIFKKLRLILSRHLPPLTAITDTETRYEVVSKKPNEFMGKKRDAVWFGAVMIQGSYVGLYLMHVYVKPGYVEKIGPELRKALKGKSCFHIKKLDDVLTKQIEKAVEDGIKCYRELNFI